MSDIVMAVISCLIAECIENLCQISRAKVKMVNILSSF